MSSSVPGTHCGNVQCEHWHCAVLLHYKCHVCLIVLHPSTLSCSKAVDKDGQVIKCLRGQGCNGVARLPACQAEENHCLAQCTLDSSFGNGLPFVSQTTMMTASGMTVTVNGLDDRKPAAKATLPLESFELDSDHPSPIPLQPLPQNQGKAASSSNVESGVISLRATSKLTKRKQGPKPHGRWNELDSSIWFDACKKFSSRSTKMTINAFLQSNKVGRIFNGRKSQCVSFGQKLQLYKNKALTSDSHQKNVAGHFLEVKKQAVKYLLFQQQHYLQDKCGLSWQIIKE